MSDYSTYQNINIDQIPISIAIYKPKDDDFIFVGFNSHAEETDKISRDKLLGKKLTEVFPNVKEFGIFDVFQRVRDTHKNETHELAFYEDNHRKGWRVNEIIANDDGTIMAIYRDVSEEVYLKQKMQSLGYFVNSSDNEYYIFNAKTLKFTYYNESAKKNIGYSFEELQKMTPLDIKPDLTEIEFKAMLAPLISQDKKQVVFNTRHRRKDMTLYDVEARVQLMDIDGEEQFVATILDITERLEKELELQKKQKMLIAQSKLASLGEMIGNIAHQWRQPLNAISTIASTIEISIDFDRFEKDEAKKNLKKIVGVTQYLSSTIDDFRNFFKPNKDIEEFTLSEVYEKNLTLLSNSFQNKEIELIENIQDVKISGYYNEMTQAILNILNNARDILETVNYRRVIFIDIYEENGYGVLSIKDNGGGIPTEIKDKIFEPYFTTKHQSQGTGIGLYMTEEIIVKHMKGFIDVIVEPCSFQGDDYTCTQFLVRVPILID